MISLIFLAALLHISVATLCMALTSLASEEPLPFANWPAIIKRSLTWEVQLVRFAQDRFKRHAAA